MKRFMVVAMVSLLAGCANFKQARIETIPQEYAVKTNASLVKQFMQSYQISPNFFYWSRYFDDVQIVDEQTVSGVLKGDFFRNWINPATFVVSIVDAGGGEKHVDVSLEVKNAEGEAGLAQELGELKRDLNLFLLGGRCRR